MNTLVRLLCKLSHAPATPAGKLALSSYSQWGDSKQNTTWLCMELFGWL